MLFGSLCYYAWGTDIKEPIITEILPSADLWVQIMKLLYILNLIYSYRVIITPTFSTLEHYILGVKETKTDEEAPQEPASLFWKVNCLRSVVIFLTLVVVLLVSKSLDKFYAVSGAILGMVNVVLLPAICH